jgi:hypothetical protein
MNEVRRRRSKKSVAQAYCHLLMPVLYKFESIYPGAELKIEVFPGTDLLLTCQYKGETWHHAFPVAEIDADDTFNSKLLDLIEGRLRGDAEPGPDRRRRRQG